MPHHLLLQAKATTYIHQLKIGSPSPKGSLTVFFISWYFLFMILLWFFLGEGAVVTLGPKLEDFEQLLCARHCSKHATHINSFNPHNYPMRLC